MRAWKSVGGGTTYFLYDGSNPICELDGTGAVTATNTWGGSLLSRRTGTGLFVASTFYTFDPSGNLAQRLDGAGNVLGAYAFDAFGLRTGTDSTTDPYAGFGGGWGYYADAETGLSLLGHRYYDTGTGRFVTRDPIGYDGGNDLYAYVENNPVNWIDPDGYNAWALGLRLAGGAEIVGGGPEDPVADLAAGTILGVAGGITLYDYLTHRPTISPASKPYCPNRSLPKKAPGTSDDGKPLREKDANGKPVEEPHTQLGQLENGDPQAREWPQKPSKGRDVPVRDIHWSDHGTPEYHPDVPHQRVYDPKTGQKGPNLPFP